MKLSPTIILFSIFCTLSFATANAEPIKAEWQPQKVNFAYLGGSSTAYSCDGLRSKVSKLLKHLGAKDVKVRNSGCAGPIGIPKSPTRVKAEFKILAITDGVEDGQSINSDWQEVRIGHNSPYNINDADCELLNQFVRKILPSFSHKEPNGKFSCVPGHRSQIRTVTIPVLMPVAENNTDTSMSIEPS